MMRKKYIIIILFVFHFSLGAESMTFSECSDLARNIVTEIAREEYHNQCRDIVFSSAGVTEKTESEDGSIKVYGHHNLLFMHYPEDVDGEILEQEASLIGAEPGFEKINILKLDLEREWVTGIFDDREIKSFYYKIGGNMAATREFTVNSLADPKSVSSNKDYILIFFSDGKIEFYPKLAHKDGHNNLSKPIVLKEIQGPNTKLTDVVDGVVVGDDFFVYDKSEKKVFKFPISAQGDAAPTQTLDPGVLSSEVLKVEYSSSSGKILLVLSDGTTHEVAPE